jgi:flagellar FliJ protein
VKKFAWRLQRLLDIKIRQEDAIRAELVAITEQAVAVRSQVMIRKTVLRQMLAELAKKDAKQRLSEQEFFLRYAHVSDDAIKKLELRLSELEKVRQRKIKEVMKARRFRKGLERLRAEAKAEFMREEQRYELKESDEKSTVSFARKILRYT